MIDFYISTKISSYAVLIVSYLFFNYTLAASSTYDLTSIEIQNKKEIQETEEEAQKGNVNAQYNAGLIYKEGRYGAPKNFIKAEHYFTQAANNGDPAAQHALGQLSKNTEEKERWYTLSSKQGFGKAQNDLGHLLFCEDRYDEAKIWLNRAAQQNIPEAYFILAKIAAALNNTEKKIENLKTASSLGYAPAHKDLAAVYWEIYDNNNGKYENIECLTYVLEATKLTLKLIALQDVSSSVEVSNNEMALKDERKALEKFILKDVDRGGEAFYLLGKISICEREPFNNVKIHFEKAGNVGYSKGYFKLGRLYHKGIGTERDIRNAVKSYKLAAEIGYHNAYYYLGKIVEKELAGKDSIKKCIEFYKASANKGGLKAQAALKRLHSKGHYMPLDEEATIWYHKSIENNQALSQINLNHPNPFKLSYIICTDLHPYFALTQVKGVFHPRLHNNLIYNPLYQVLSNTAEYEEGVLAIDPSGAGKDETAYCVAKRYRNKYFILDLGGCKGGYEEEPRVGFGKEVCEMLSSIAEEYKVSKVVIEANFGGNKAYNWEDLIDYLPIHLENKVYPFRPSNNKKDRIIKTLNPLLNSRSLIIDRGVLERDFRELPQDITFKFFYQLTIIALYDRPNLLKHDDRIDALSLAIDALKNPLQQTTSLNIEEVSYATS